LNIEDLKMLEVTILAVLQGIAEFLPISSSGHLVIGQHLLGLGGAGMRLDVFLHVGTLISIAVFYFSRLVSMVRSKEWVYCAKILVSALPAVAVYFCFNDFVESMFSNVKMVGALLMFTGAVLVGTRFIPKRKNDVSFMRALIMGLGQALALLPGVSRSGMTLASARAGGVDPEKSAEFSFLMSAPLIAGAAVLEVLKSLGSSAETSDVSWSLAVYGCLLSAVVGYFSLKALIIALKGKWFWLFGPYCIFAGLVTLLFCGA
jgi:undecaprenyl-diphosphatase